MKQIFAIILIYIFVTPAFSAAIISGTVINSKSKYINLVYMGSSSVSSPNYYGEKRYCEEIQNKKFRFNIETSAENSVFILEFANGQQSFKILVKDLDNIHINVDLNNPMETFEAKGKGSSMTNYLFAENKISTKTIPKLKPEEIIPFWKSQQKHQLYLLKSFRSKIFENKEQLDKKEVSAITRLINISDLSDKECRLLENRTNYFIVRAFDQTPFDFLRKNLDTYLELYSNIDWSNDFIINDFVTDNLVANLICLTDYKRILTRDSSVDRKFMIKHLNDNYPELAKQVLKGDILQKTLCDNMYNLMLERGHYERFYELFSENEKIITNPAYRKKLEVFHSNYLNAFINPKFGLNAKSRELNDSSVFELMNSLKGNKVYLILWDVHSDTSYPLCPLWQLSTIKKLQAKYKKDVRFVNICIGAKQEKQHWASQIVNHNWKGEHYYYLDTAGSKFREKFGCTKILESCGGEAYYLLSESGKIGKNNGSSLITEIE